MKSQHMESRAKRNAICTAMAAVLVAGCAGTGPVAVKASTSAPVTKADRAVAKSITQAERRVRKAPDAAATRTALGNAYLVAGRFESAVTTYEDAQHLGDGSARTALSLALAHVGAGNNSSAVTLLNEWNGVIPDSDFGLALALAGETERGVQILSDALRDGNDTAKLRQNLAYAYALDGRWRDARLMAAQDVPADQLDARISQWARQGRAEDFRARVASMLGAPMVVDQGQPAHLALMRTPVEAPTALAAAETGPDAELPPINDGASFWLAEAPQPEVPQPESTPAAAEPVAVSPVLAKAEPAVEQTIVTDTNFAEAFAPSSPVSGFVSDPVIQAIPERVAVAEKPQRKSRPVTRARSLVPAVKATASGSHLVQLGSFSSQKNADRAWKLFRSRNPEFSSAEKTITAAMVRGKKYWRVSAGGFDRRSANKVCSQVKARGASCITYAKKKPLPGTVD